MVRLHGIILLLAAVLAGGALHAQGEAELLREVGESLQTARANKADVLAPNSFDEAAKLYREAQDEYSSGKGKLADIRKKLNSAGQYLGKVDRVIEVAEVAIPDAIKARSDAMAAGAPEFFPDEWEKAEKRLKDATGRIENGKNLNDAKKRAAEAAEMYRDVELEAIKANYLTETRDLLKQADDEDVDDRAPQTLERSRELVDMAEKELEENRYDKDVARNLARQAKYEVRHAIYLSRHIKEVRDNDLSMEEIMLNAEAPLERIAAALDIVPQFDQGLEPVAIQLEARVREKLDELDHTRQELADRDTQIVNYKARIDELEEQLGGIAAQQSELQKRMEAQERIREKFVTIEKLFTREEANVFRQGNQVILRLVGLNFDSGKSEIKPAYFSLLTKVEQAIKTFPEATITVEGHTDAYGGDKLNLDLSRNRAEAVRQYLLANISELDVSMTRAVGFGESKPIANNETREGRAKNRRIDIVIEPNLAY